MIAALFALASLALSASAHFQMQFPDPRGPFVEDNEVNFCDGYTDATPTRETFPLSNGFININSEHVQWTAAVLISLEANPTNFSVFNTSSTGVQLPFAVPFFGAEGEGPACIPVDIASLNIPGVQDGSNVTLQVQFNGGDGNLFQCTDVTLSSSFQIPSNITCANKVNEGNTASGSTTSTAPGATNTNAAQRLAGTVTGVLAILSAVAIVTL